jgi:DNA-directed RNA polymerase subunit RPC12/RpoP
MDWHSTPKDDAWKQAHLEMLVKLGMELMLRCDHCQHRTVEDPRLFAARYELDIRTPMLTISKALRCSHCGQKRGRAMPEPSNSKPRTQTAALY